MILGIIGLIAAIIVTGAIIYCGWQAIVMFTYADRIARANSFHSYGICSLAVGKALW